MSFGLEDIENLMKEFDMDLFDLREAILLWHKHKISLSKGEVSAEFEWELFKELEDKEKKH